MRAEPLFWEPLIVIITLPSWRESNRKWVIQLDDTNVRSLLDYVIHSFLRPLSLLSCVSEFSVNTLIGNTMFVCKSLNYECNIQHSNPSVGPCHIWCPVLTIIIPNVRSQIFPCCPHFGRITFDWEQKTSCDIWQHYINMVKDQGGGVVKFIKDVDLPVACWDVVVSRMSGARTSELRKTRQWYQIRLSATSKAKTDNLCYRRN